MFYLLFPILIPFLTILLFPPLIQFIFQKPFPANRYLYLASLAYFLSWYLPSPLIYGQNTSFTTHLIGGGIYSGFLWLYIYSQQKTKLSSVRELISLFTFTSALGTLNELFELFIVQTHLVKKLNIKDTSWDLLANTVGCLIFYLAYRIALQFDQPFRKHV